MILWCVEKKTHFLFVTTYYSLLVQVSLISEIGFLFFLENGVIAFLCEGVLLSMDPFDLHPWVSPPPPPPPKKPFFLTREPKKKK